MSKAPPSVAWAARDEWARHCAELLEPALGAVQPRRMFGGHGLFVDGRMVALALANELYLKADAASAPQWQAAGCRPFAYATSARTVQVGYYAPPADALESPAALADWARLALAAALRAASTQRPVKASTPRRRSR